MIAALPAVASATEPAREAPALQQFDARLAESDPPVRIRNVAYPDQCLVSLAPPQATSPFTYTCGYFHGEVWQLVWAESGYQLKNAASGLCLVAQGNPARRPFASTCNAQSTDQRWWLSLHGGPEPITFSFTNRYGGGCLYRAWWDSSVFADLCDQGTRRLWHIDL
jgi:hypothetical protein